LLPSAHMKYLSRVFVFHVISLWFVSNVFPALVIVGDWQTFFWAGFALSLLMLLVAPILRILFIPINFLTFGLINWLINAIVLYLLTIFLPEVSVRSWTFPGASVSGFVIPSIHLTYPLALVAASLFLTFCVDLLYSISEH